MKLKVHMMTAEEIRSLAESGSLSEQETRLLYLLHRDRTNDVGAMREMHIGGRQYYQVKRGLSLKILRSLLESNTDI